MRAAIYCTIGAMLSFVGLIHGVQVAWNAGGQVALGYLFFGFVCLGVRLGKYPAPRGAGR
jgi:AGZA family xanthine/uracil permease-like MFS transporter